MEETVKKSPFLRYPLRFLRTQSLILQSTLHPRSIFPQNSCPSPMESQRIASQWCDYSQNAFCVTGVSVLPLQRDCFSLEAFIHANYCMSQNQLTLSFCQTLSCCLLIHSSLLFRLHLEKRGLTVGTSLAGTCFVEIGHKQILVLGLLRGFPLKLLKYNSDYFFNKKY